MLRRFTLAGALGGVAYGFCVRLAASFFYAVDFPIGTGAMFLTSVYGLFSGAALGFGAGDIWAALAWAYRSACARKRENGGRGRPRNSLLPKRNFNWHRGDPMPTSKRPPRSHPQTSAALKHSTPVDASRGLKRRGQPPPAPPEAAAPAVSYSTRSAGQTSMNTSPRPQFFLR
jgi:hypothetical protein